MVSVVATAQAIADQSWKAPGEKLRCDHKLMVRDLNAVFDEFPADPPPEPNVMPGGKLRPNG